MFQKQNPEIGARPGTLAIPPDSPFPRVVVVQYDTQSVDRREVENLEELHTLRDDDRVTWVDVQGLGDEATLRALAEIFELHPVALENAVNVPQRAKTELYEHHQLVIARTPRIEEGGLVRTPQVCFIIGQNYLLTFQERYFGFFDPVRERIRAGIGAIRTEGPDYLAYALIDAMMDRYYPVAQYLADGLEELEDIVVENPRPEVLSRIHAYRRQLVVLRRVGWPQREAINAMLREQSPFFHDQVKVYLRDTYDRSHGPNRRAHRFGARDGFGHRRCLPIEREPSHERDHEGLDPDGEHLHSVDFRGGNLRYELREYAGTRDAKRILRGSDRDGRPRGRHVCILQIPRLDWDVTASRVRSRQTRASALER